MKETVIKLCKELVTFISICLLVTVMQIAASTVFSDLAGINAQAASWPPLGDTNCKCCHWAGDSAHVTHVDRHHILIQTYPETYNCFSCHALVQDPVTQNYSVVTPDLSCMGCHTGTPIDIPIATIHHMTEDYNTGNCAACHESEWNPDTNAQETFLSNHCEGPQYGTVQGQVVDVNGFPIEDVIIYTPSFDELSTLTDANGMYQLQAFTLDYSSFRAARDNYVALADSGPVTVQNGETVVADFVMDGGGTITGLVKDINGDPMEGVLVFTDDLVYQDRTDSDGRFILSSVRVGDYVVKTRYTVYSTYQSDLITMEAGYKKYLSITLYTAEICDDGIDNNGNGLIDCEEASCDGTPNCLGPEICDDGIDNDGDGLFDCNDTDDCAGTISCLVPEKGNCNDGIDNDLDGKTDCDDTKDCRKDPSC